MASSPCSTLHSTACSRGRSGSVSTIPGTRTCRSHPGSRRRCGRGCWSSSAPGRGSPMRDSARRCWPAGCRRAASGSTGGTARTRRCWSRCGRSMTGATVPSRGCCGWRPERRCRDSPTAVSSSSTWTGCGGRRTWRGTTPTGCRSCRPTPWCCCTAPAAARTRPGRGGSGPGSPPAIRASSSRTGRGWACWRRVPCHRRHSSRCSARPAMPPPRPGCAAASRSWAGVGRRRRGTSETAASGWCWPRGPSGPPTSTGRCGACRRSTRRRRPGRPRGRSGCGHSACGSTGYETSWRTPRPTGIGWAWRRSAGRPRPSMRRRDPRTRRRGWNRLCGSWGPPARR